MPQYIYIAKPAPDKTIQGEIEAESESEAVTKLTKLGYFPISIEALNISLERKSFFPFRKVSKQEVVVFTRQLSNLIGSGINIINGLNIISRQTTNKYFRAVINDVVSKIKDGKSLSDSLNYHPQIFSNLYVQLIHSGEVGGNIDGALERLSGFLEKEQDFSDSLSSALIYPIFIMLVGIGTIIVLLTFVIPRLTVMFEDMGQVLPLPTRALIAASNALRIYWWMILAIVITGVFLFRRSQRVVANKIVWDRIKLKLVFFGDIILKSEISRLMHTLALLLSSGITITSSLDISAALAENEILRIELLRFRERINDGLSLSRCLSESKLFPSMVNSIVSVGEETGTLEKALLRISQDYEKEVDSTIKNLTRMLEPVIILVMGIIVGFIVISMLLPIFQINLLAR
ncbi:MAG: type II secretion system F family protein [Candidatus Omnitrophica bacterium]|nr:type II secretion system F family protein [Candidatus Omnitrophota bacterium]MDD5652821.1 type II secretion system F family protein [Candidatus Omnitrophota bacterium]